MREFTRSILLLMGIVNFIVSCDLQEQDSLPVEESEIFKNVEFYPDLGKKHNAILADYFQRSKFEGRTYAERIEEVETFFATKYNADVSGTKYSLFGVEKENFNARVKSGELEFDPFVVLENNKDRMTERVYGLLVNFFIRTEEIQEWEEELVFLEEFEQSILSEESLSEGDKNGLRNIILVYKYSAEYWQENLQDWNARMSEEGRVMCDENNYQKIAWADIIEGTAGGLLGGPAGALVGLAAGSLTMAIGVC
jgi:hypothetical protein